MKKIKLEKISVSSFITSVGKNEKVTLEGKNGSLVVCPPKDQLPPITGHAPCIIASNSVWEKNDFCFVVSQAPNCDRDNRSAPVYDCHVLQTDRDCDYLSQIAPVCPHKQ